MHRQLSRDQPDRRCRQAVLPGRLPGRNRGVDGGVCPVRRGGDFGLRPTEVLVAWQQRLRGRLRADVRRRTEPVASRRCVAIGTNARLRNAYPELPALPGIRAGARNGCQRAQRLVTHSPSPSPAPSLAIGATVLSVSTGYAHIAPMPRHRHGGRVGSSKPWSSSRGGDQLQGTNRAVLRRAGKEPTD